MSLLVIDYDKTYDESVKDLLVELQEHISGIDQEGYHILTEGFRELYFKKVLEDVNKHNGKILLYKEE